MYIYYTFHYIILFYHFFIQNYFNAIGSLCNPHLIKCLILFPFNHKLSFLHFVYFYLNRFKFYCCTVPDFSILDCAWTPYVNTWDEDFVYVLDESRVLCGVGSEHDNGAECVQHTYFNLLQNIYTINFYI